MISINSSAVFSVIIVYDTLFRLQAKRRLGILYRFSWLPLRSCIFPGFNAVNPSLLGQYINGQGNLAPGEVPFAVIPFIGAFHLF
jgi:hypothetical protein